MRSVSLHPIVCFRVDSTQLIVPLTPDTPVDPLENPQTEVAVSGPVEAPRTDENPPWGIPAVLLIAIFNFLAFNLIAVAFFVAIHAIPRFRGLSLEAFTQSPLALVPQMLSYLFAIFFMVLVVQKETSESFWSAIKWNWPSRITSLILAGVALLGIAQLCSALLPIPKSLPIDRFFRSTHAAWVLAIFGIFIGPFYEELLFRGFLFPALRRYLPLLASVIIDGLLFALYHGPQLAWSWAPMLLIFVVGAVLTVVRARTGSLGSAFLVHSAYNAFDFVLIFAATDGFRHMDKLR